MRVLHASLARHIKSTPEDIFGYVPRAESKTWDGWVALFDEHAETLSEKEGPNFILAKLLKGVDENGRYRLLRRKTHVELLDFIGFDFDENVPDDWAERLGQAFPSTRYVYTTHSHGRPEKGNRGRGIYPLTRSVTSEEYAVLILWAQNRVAAYGLPPDKSCKDTTRPFYTPRIQAADGAPRLCESIRETCPRTGEAIWFDPDNLPDGASVGDLLADLEKERTRQAERIARTCYTPGEIADVSQLSKRAKSHAQAYAHRACLRALEKVRTATKGLRNLSVYKAGLIFGGYEANGCISREEADKYLDNAVHEGALNIGSADDLRRQAENGLRDGRGKPFPVPKLVTEKDLEAPEVLPIIDDDTTSLPLEEAREKTANLIREAGSKPGLVCISATPGTGKTTAALKLAFEAVNQGKTVRYVAATNDAIEERKLELREIIKREYPDLDEPEQLENGAPNLASFTSSFVSEQQKRTEKNCYHMPLVQLGRRLYGEKGAKAACRSCARHPANNKGKAYCGFFPAMFHGSGEVRGTILFTTHALEQSTEQRPVDLLLIDEFPDPTYQAHRVEPSDVESWIAGGDLTLDEDSKTRLRGLFAKAEADRKMRYISTSLAEAVPAGSLQVKRDDEGELLNRWGRERTHELSSAWSDGKTPAERVDVMERLKRTADHLALEALEDICSTGWKGSYIGSSRRSDADSERTPALILGTSHVLKLQDATTAMLLDGTSTAAVAACISNDAVTYHRIRADLNPGASTTRVPWSASKGKIPLPSARNKDGTPAAPSSVTIQKLRTLVSLYESKETLWVLHKHWRTSDLIQELLPDAFKEERVTHYGASDAVGSNKHAHLKRNVLMDWFVPLAAKEARAESLAQACPRNNSANWPKEAAQLMEGRAIEQAMHRVRPCLFPREIIFVTDRELPKYLDPWRKPDVDLDVVAYEMEGIIPRGQKGIVLQLAKRLRERGHVLVRSLTGKTKSPLNTLGDLSEYLSVAHPSTVRFVASEAGGSVAYLSHGSPGASWQVVYDPANPPTADAIAKDLQATGKAPPWIEWLGERLDLRGDRGAILGALPGLSHLTSRSLALRLGFDERTLFRRLKTAGLTMSEVRELWAQVNRPPTITVTLDEGDDPVELEAGGRAWLRYAPQAFVEMWLAITTGYAGPPIPRCTAPPGDSLAAA